MAVTAADDQGEGSKEQVVKKPDVRTIPKFTMLTSFSETECI